MNRLIIYTDGSAIGNGNADSKCGWACKFIYGNQKRLISGNDRGKTNNQMEMIAVLQAMRAVREKSVPVTVYSDSKYVVETMNGNYSMKTNRNLWKQLVEETHKFDDIKFKWVRGHSGNAHNNEVDALATQEARKRRQ